MQFGAHGREVYADTTTFADAFVVPADASPVEPASGVIDLTYRHPSTGDVVHAAVFARTFVDRSVEGRVQVEVARSDPHAVRLQGERRGWFDEMPYLIVLLVVPLVSYVLRHAHVRRIDRLAASPAVSYAMLGAVTPPQRLHPRWRLCLYPIDAQAGAQPVCVVELIWLPVLPVGAFPVEVKGEPRPFGAVAVRAGEEVLWPRGRALAQRTRMGRPATTGAFPRLPRPAAVFPVPPRPSLWPARLLRIAGLVALAAYLWVGGGTSWRDEQALERSRPATATVIAVDAGDLASGGSVTVRYDRDGTPTEARLPVQARAPDLGAQVPIRYDIDDAAVVWETGQRGPADPQGDILLTFTIIATTGLLVLAAIVRHQALARLGEHELATTGQVDMGTLPVPLQ